MADRRTYNRQVRTAATYQYGSAARVLEEYPVNERKKKVEKQPVQYEKRVPAYGFLYTVFLVLTAAFMIFSLCSYLDADARLKNSESEILSLKQDLQFVQQQNSILEESLNPLVDLDYIYEQAVGRLGMVRAGKDQIIYYDGSKEDYIRQFGEIPGN